VVVDDTLSWRKHIDLINKRLKNITTIVYNIKPLVPVDILRMLYIALAESLIRYGITAWGSASDTYINSIKERQIILIKKIAGFKSRCQFSVNAFQHLNVLSVRALFMQKILYKYYFSPKYKELCNHEWQTRYKDSGKFVIPQSLNKYGERTLNYIVPSTFNKLPPQLLSLTHVCRMKREVRDWLMNNS
jgi:hypothetical protein